MKQLFLVKVILISACHNDKLKNCTDETALFTLTDFPISIAWTYFGLAQSITKLDE